MFKRCGRYMYIAYAFGRSDWPDSSNRCTRNVRSSSHYLWVCIFSMYIQR